MKKEKYNVTGMTCAACQANVERCVSRLEGIQKVEVNLMSGRMNVEYDENIVTDEKIISAVTDIGYGVETEKGRSDNKENSAEVQRRSMLRRLISSLVLMTVLMYIAMGHMIGLPMPGFFDGTQNALPAAMTQMLLAAWVMLINRKFFTVGIRALISRAPNMDSLVAIGSGASFVYGVVVIYRMAYSLGHGDMGAVAHHAHDLYFESAAMILTLVTVGKYLEARSKARTTDALDSLMALAPKTATVIRDGAEVTVDVADIRVGDMISVKAGESIAVDGRIVSGHGWVDQSAVTGEGIPVEKCTGDEVISATVNHNGSFVYQATKVGEETTIAQIIRMVDEAGATKPPIARLADKVSGVFVPVVMGIAIVTFIVWALMGRGVDTAFSLSISVLVISCPCALGLATPVAIMVGTGRAAQMGILVKSAAVLETLHRVDTVVLDKTGTITEGAPRVSDVILLSGDRKRLLSLALSIEGQSLHPLAQAVSAYAAEQGAEKYDITDFELIPGRGVRCICDALPLIAGNPAVMREEGIDIPDDDIADLAKGGKTAIIFAHGGVAVGVIALEDGIRIGSAEAIRAMRSAGLKVVMLTGDNVYTAEAVKRETGIDEYMSDVMPGDKEAYVRDLQSRGHRVVMVGDGINDAPALVSADVGIAIGAGTDIAIDSADVVLLKNDLSDVLCAIELGRAVIRNIKLNLFWAFFYNILGIPLAAGALYIPFGIKLNPMIGSAAMSLSSVSVVTNALRLYAFKNKRAKQYDQTEIINDKGDNKMTKVLNVEGMMCVHCKAHVEKALTAIDGVESAVADLEAKTATVTLGTDISDEVLVKAVSDAGYTCNMA